MRTKQKSPSLRCVRVTRSGKPGSFDWWCDVGKAHLNASGEVSAREFAKRANAEISRRVAARERKWVRAIEYVALDLASRWGALMVKASLAVDALDRGDAKAARRRLVAGLKGRQ